MTFETIEAVGICAAVITTACWLPQIVKIWRCKSTKDLSFATQAAFTFGVLLWFVYGIGLGRPAIILANGMTLALSAGILGLKLRYG